MTTFLLLTTLTIIGFLIPRLADFLDQKWQFNPNEKNQS